MATQPSAVGSYKNTNTNTIPANKTKINKTKIGYRPKKSSKK